jgi:uncharacterized protein YukE
VALAVKARDLETQMATLAAENMQLRQHVLRMQKRLHAVKHTVHPNQWQQKVVGLVDMYRTLRVQVDDELEAFAQALQDMQDTLPRPRQLENDHGFLFTRKTTVVEPKPTATKRPIHLMERIEEEPPRQTKIPVRTQTPPTKPKRQAAHKVASYALPSMKKYTPYSIQHV